MTTTATPKRRLGFGYEAGLPADATAAWGARAIYERGSFSLLWDRQSTFGDEKAVRAIGKQLNAGALKEAAKDFERLHQHGLVTPSSDKELVLYDQLDGLIIKANPQGSCGYVYLVAYVQGGK